MARIIKSESAARTRQKQLQWIARSFRRYASGELTEAQRMDVLAFIALALEEIVQSVDATVLAWEKRDYWLKADRFRMDWFWAERCCASLSEALGEGDVARAEEALMALAQPLASVKLPARGAKQTPWDGAWERWRAQTSGD